MLMPAVFHENLFDDLFDPFFYGTRNAERADNKHFANMMKTDVKQTDSSYEVAVELPGCKKEDVQMELQDGYLTIQAVCRQNNDQNDENGRYLRRERFVGTCARSFYVGTEVRKEDIKARFADGILYITLPKAEKTKTLPANPNLIEIE